MSYIQPNNEWKASEENSTLPPIVIMNWKMCVCGEKCPYCALLARELPCAHFSIHSHSILCIPHSTHMIRLQLKFFFPNRIFLPSECKFLNSITRLLVVICIHACMLMVKAHHSHTEVDNFTIIRAFPWNIPISQNLFIIRRIATHIMKSNSKLAHKCLILQNIIIQLNFCSIWLSH